MHACITMNVKVVKQGLNLKVEIAVYFVATELLNAHQYKQELLAAPNFPICYLKKQ
jgi:hypothetical protein